MSDDNVATTPGQVTLSSPRRVTLRPLRWWWIGIAAVFVIAAGVGIGWWLWAQSRWLPQPEMAQARADAIRIGLTAAGGTGAALALLLAVRRQRATEIALTLQDADLAQREQVAAAAALDATERRITELYTKAVEQLGSDKAPVRLGGLHALERLAQDNENHRQTIVDVICAYLRMPYRPPGRPHALPLTQSESTQVDDIESESLGISERQQDEQREQEYQVRKTAQRILTAHLQPGFNESNQPTNPKFWSAIRIELTGAYLIDFNLSHCQVTDLTCNRTIFAGECLFRDFTCNWAFIQGAHFTRDPNRGTFTADFRGAHFKLDAWFSGTTFDHTPWFHADQFFSGPRFDGCASFRETTFLRGARFDGASFSDDPDFTNARVRADCGDQPDWPNGWVESPEANDAQQRMETTTPTWNRIVQAENDSIGDPGKQENR